MSRKIKKKQDSAETAVQNQQTEAADLPADNPSEIQEKPETEKTEALKQEESDTEENSGEKQNTEECPRSSEEDKQPEDQSGSESAGNSEEPKNAEESAPEEEKPKKEKGSRKMIVFGAVVLIFAFIGLVSTGIWTAAGINWLIEHDSEKDDLEWMITPVIMQDPPQFESPENVPDTILITAGVWQLIMNADLSKYPTDEVNFLTVPASDIEVQIKMLFGDVKYTHQTVSDSMLMIIYNEKENSYIFPAAPHILAYTPSIEKIEKVDDTTKILTVGYIPPGPIWHRDDKGNRMEPQPEKMMELTLKADENEVWQIYSLSGEPGGQLYPELPFDPIEPEESSEESSKNEPVSVPDETESSGETSEDSSQDSSEESSSESTEE